jgi:hypothetical protein
MGRARKISHVSFSGGFQEKPKRMAFVMDISGSMSRFNGQDGRLTRLMQCTAMVWREEGGTGRREEEEQEEQGGGRRGEEEGGRRREEDGLCDGHQWIHVNIQRAGWETDQADAMCWYGMKEEGGTRRR